MLHLPESAPVPFDFAAAAVFFRALPLGAHVPYREMLWVGLSGMLPKRPAQSGPPVTLPLRPVQEGPHDQSDAGIPPSA